MFNPVLQFNLEQNNLFMNKKTPLYDYFETYRPFSRDGADWYVISNLTWNPKFIVKHSDEESARNHARRLNELWREEFYASPQASCDAPDQPPHKSDNVSLLKRLKSLLVDTLLLIRYRFLLR